MAYAEGLSADIELARWSLAPFTPAGMDGVQSGRVGGGGRVGLIAGYADAPLSLLNDEGEREVLIANRQSAELVTLLQLSPQLALRLSLPGMRQWGTADQPMSADGAGLGDPGVDLQLRALQEGAAAVALCAGVRLPLGTRDAWMGEGSSRVALGVVTQLAQPRLRWTADLGLVTRPGAPDANDPVPGSEAHLNLGVWAPLPGERLAVTGALLSRFTGQSLWLTEAPLPLEALAGLQVLPRSPLHLELGLGRGLTAGLGTSAFRATAGVSWGWGAGPPAATPPPVVPVASVPAPAVVVLPEDRGVRITGGRLLLEDEILFFAQGSAALLPETAQAIGLIARALEEHPEVSGLIIEGHASAEGDAAYNQSLSEARAHAVWSALRAAGVSPRRLSYRGLGAAQASALDPDADRRVEFYVTSGAAAAPSPPPVDSGAVSPGFFEEDVP